MKIYSLHIGINKYDNEKYGVNIPELFVTHHDVKSLQAIASQRGFITTKLLDEQANYANVISYLEKTAEELENGDIFWFTFSGHGTQIPDISSDEIDKKDEAFVLYDRLLFDDEFKSYLAKFAEGVKILVIVDACHSGTINRGKKKARFIPSNIWLDSNINKEIRKTEEIKASGILIAACQDQEVAYEDNKNGLFTSVISKLFETENRLTAKKLVELAIVKLKGKQKPKYSVFGQNTVSFARQSLNKIYQSNKVENTVKESLKTEIIEVVTKNENEMIEFLVKELRNLSLTVNSFLNTLETLIK